MREILAWTARGVVLLSVGWLVWAFMPPEFRQPIEHLLALLRR